MHPARPLKYLRLTGPLPVDETVSTLVRVRVYRAGDWSVVQIDGELDIQSVPAVPPLLTGDGAPVVSALTHLTFMDCRGLRLPGPSRSAASRTHIPPSEHVRRGHVFVRSTLQPPPGASPMSRSSTNCRANHKPLGPDVSGRW